MSDHNKYLLHSDPHPNCVETAEQLHHACRVELMRMESNLRVKGDVWRADRVRRFRIESFGEEKPEKSSARQIK